jgi:hypothetical protein
MSEHLTELILKRYEIVTARLSAVDQWAQNFVSLYFVFCATLITAAGFSIALIDDRSVLHLLRLPVPTRLFSIISVSIIGLLFSLWSSTIVWEWVLRRRRIIRQIRRLESELDSLEASHGSSTNRTRHLEWDKTHPVDRLAIFLTAVVLFVTTFGWLVLLASAVV